MCIYITYIYTYTCIIYNTCTCGSLGYRFLNKTDWGGFCAFYTLTWECFVNFLISISSSTAGLLKFILKICCEGWKLRTMTAGVPDIKRVLGFHKHLKLELTKITTVACLLEKAMAPHSSTLAWRIPWTEEPGRLHSPRGRDESDTTERPHFYFSLACTGKGNGNPLQRSCLENPRDGGAW